MGVKTMLNMLLCEHGFVCGAMSRQFLKGATTTSLVIGKLQQRSRQVETTALGDFFFTVTFIRHFVVPLSHCTPLAARTIAGRG